MRCQDCESETDRSSLTVWHDGRDLCRRCWLIAEYLDQQPDHSRNTAAATADTIVELEAAIARESYWARRNKLIAFLDGVKYQACLLPCHKWPEYLPRFQQPSHTFKKYEAKP